MANFLRRLITKSRSNSPQKSQQQQKQQPTFPKLECEDDECCYLAGPSTMVPNHVPIQQLSIGANRRQPRGDVWTNTLSKVDYLIINVDLFLPHFFYHKFQVYCIFGCHTSHLSDDRGV